MIVCWRGLSSFVGSPGLLNDLTCSLLMLPGLSASGELIDLIHLRDRHRCASKPGRNRIDRSGCRRCVHDKEHPVLASAAIAVDVYVS